MLLTVPELESLTNGQVLEEVDEDHRFDLQKWLASGMPEDLSGLV